MKRKLRRAVTNSRNDANELDGVVRTAASRRMTSWDNTTA